MDLIIIITGEMDRIDFLEEVNGFDRKIRDVGRKVFLSKEVVPRKIDVVG